MSGKFDHLLKSEDVPPTSIREAGERLALSDVPYEAMQGRLAATGLPEIVQDFWFKEINAGTKLIEAEAAVLTMVAALISQNIEAQKLPKEIATLSAGKTIQTFSTAVLTSCKMKGLI